MLLCPFYKTGADTRAMVGNSLQAVYCIGILDFTFDDYDSEPDRSEFYHSKATGEPLEKIIRYTGLSVEEIEKI